MIVLKLSLGVEDLGLEFGRWKMDTLDVNKLASI